MTIVCAHAFTALRPPAAVAAQLARDGQPPAARDCPAGAGPDLDLAEGEGDRRLLHQQADAFRKELHHAEVAASRTHRRWKSRTDVNVRLSAA